MSVEQSRPRLIIRRWISLVCCGLVAATIVLVFEPLLRRLFASGVEWLSALGSTTMILAVAVLTTAACWCVGRDRWQGFIGIRHFFAYPPLWLTVLIAIGVLESACVWLDRVDDRVSLIEDICWLATQLPALLWLGLAIGTSVLLFHKEIADFLRSRFQRSPRRCDVETVLIDESFEDLCDWLQDDSPVKTPSKDRFQHDSIARRMAQRLDQDQEFPTMALVGGLGSGKSSIKNLVKHHLRNATRVKVIELSLWPFASTKAAVRGILQAIIDELAKHVNVLPLVGLSDDYIGAIENMAGSYGGIARLLRGKSGPEDILDHFSRIARATRLRLVVWIEDLERFSGGDQLEGEARTQRELDRLGPIRAVLYLLDQCPNISVVLADTSLRTRFDIGKIARFVETAPEMETEYVWHCTKLLRTRCLGGYPVAVIDPTAPEVREALAPPQDIKELRAWMSEFSRRDSSDVVGSMVRVLATPRALKEALRMTLEIWKALPGEIDFDCVLVTSCLRVAHPDLYAIVSEHIHLFRIGLRDPFSRGDQEGKPHAVVERIEDYLKRVKERTARDLRTLLVYLFPKYAAARQLPEPEGSQEGEDKEYVSRPQALFVSGHADYWRRYQAQIPVSSEESDQEALRDIRAWRESTSSDLLDRISDPQRSDQVENFVNQFLPSDLCRLLREIADRLATESAEGWEDRWRAHGISVALSMMRVRRPPRNLVHRTVLEIIERYGPNHLPLAHNVAYWFANSNPRFTHVMLDVHEDQVRSQLRDVLAADFQGEGAEERLMHALKGGNPRLIYWVAYLDNDERSGLPFEGWPEFSKTLLRVAETQPTIGVPLVVAFVTKSEMRLELQEDETGKCVPNRGLCHEFDAEAAERLFDHPRLVNVLSRFDQVPDHLDEQMKACCHAASDAARAELENATHNFRKCVST